MAYKQYYPINQTTLLDAIYPIGSIYITTSTSETGTTSPASFLGGRWERLPEGYALWTTTSTITEEKELGEATSTNYRMVRAGLPNITGQYTPNGSPSRDHTGAFGTNGSFNGLSHRNETGNWTSYLTFNAASGETNVDGTLKTNDSDKVYGKSNTVQPPAYKVYAWKRIPKE